jgi:DNA-cytosine methyltransferase
MLVAGLHDSGSLALPPRTDKYVDHLSILRAAADDHEDQLEGALIKATGRYYTHHLIGSHLARTVWDVIADGLPYGARLSVIDPFAGDGRLVAWLIQHAVDEGRSDLSWSTTLWDLDPAGLEKAQARLLHMAEELGVVISTEVVTGDSFRIGGANYSEFDIVVTNPPWELLKPDRRELDRLGPDAKAEYIKTMRAYDAFLAEILPLSQPARKFAGWGTNLARVGTELAVKLARPGGVVGLVSPASALADEMSKAVRRWLLTENSLVDAAYFPAEARLFSGADVSTATLTFQRCPTVTVAPHISVYHEPGSPPAVDDVVLPREFLEESGFVVPISFGAHGIHTLVALSALPTFGELECDQTEGLWAGRELDETGVAKWLGPEGDGLFVKGRMIDRFTVVERPQGKVKKEGWTVPASVQHRRIAWRDVSRPNQKRRVKATIIPAGWIAGNSLGVAYFRHGNEERLRALLGLMSSFPFEFQLRSYLATGHVSLGALRKVHLPPLALTPALRSLADAVAAALKGDPKAEVRVEAIAAKLYGLTRSDLEDIIDHFPKVSQVEKATVLAEFDRVASNLEHVEKSGEATQRGRGMSTVVIPNHRTARLSDLDMQVALAVPPGGNWKDIPESVPSKRLETIRISYRQGKGSRSTYYGRLRPDMPSYTMNTYFNRPGNGCHLHYDYAGGQHRVLSQREAARFQSFPDSFVFYGSQGAINKQIGNAVPPLLAFQVARTLGPPGYFVDLFAGAGGLGLGFMWAGWQPLVANEIEASFLDTYRANVHEEAVLGDIRDPAISHELVTRAREGMSEHRDRPLWVLGGPPCQGFSTAGKARTMEDERNHLFWNYKDLLDALKPDGFVFENVTGLLNIEGGETFRQIKEVLSETCESITHWVLHADEYAVPQRRTRVFIIGRHREALPEPPKRLTSVERNGDFFGGRHRAVSAEEAVGDLPRLEQGQDGSELPYRKEPQSAYQAFVRGIIEAAEYLRRMEAGDR